MTVAGLDHRTLLLVAGGLYLLLPLCVWMVLRMPRHPAALLWSAGAMVAGLGLVLMGLRGTLPDWLSYIVGHPLMALGVLLVTQSLRMDLGQRWPWWFIAGVPAVYAVVLWVALPTTTPQTLGVLVRTVNLLAVLALAQTAWQVSRAESSRNALFLAATFCFQSAGIVVNLINAGSGSSDIQTLVSTHLNVITSLIILLVSLASSMGYLGLALERSLHSRKLLAQEMSLTHQVRQRRDTLVRRDRERLLGLLADSLGHEIMQPLTAALLRIQLGLRQLKAGAPAAALLPCLEDVIQNVSRACDTVARVRHFIRPLSTQYAPVGVRALLGNVQQLLRQEALNRHIDMRFPLPGEEVWVMGDGLQLSQAVLQVVRNAMTAVGQARQQIVWVSLDVTPQQVRLTITDTGPGLPPAVLELGNSKSGPWPESLQGIGLFVVQSILLRHHGLLLLENAATGGAAVTLTLQRHKPGDPPETSADSRLSSPVTQG